MKERPILFSDSMVAAILAGRKMQTRRVIKPQPSAERGLVFEGLAVGGFGVSNEEIVCPYGVVGDRLWVREGFAYHVDDDVWDCVQYRTDCSIKKPEGLDDNAGARFSALCDQPFKWRPSIHMPRWASRITLEITTVRTERLNDISEEDAKAEGAYLATWFVRGQDNHVDISGLPGFPDERASYRNGFANLWQKINGPCSWDENPWVWAITFRRAAACGAAGSWQ